MIITVAVITSWQISFKMFLIRCFKLEKEYDEYVQENKTSKPSKERSTQPGSVSKDHSGEADETLTELRTTYNNNGSHSRSFSDGGMKQTSSHPVLGRTVSADIYSDDVQLVNYEKYGREGVPYVFDDRKTSKHPCLSPEIRIVIHGPCLLSFKAL